MERLESRRPNRHSMRSSVKKGNCRRNGAIIADSRSKSTDPFYKIRLAQKFI